MLLQVGGMAWVAGIECDVSSPASVQRLMSAAASQMGSVDVWINNAGNSGGFQVRRHTATPAYILRDACKPCTRRQLFWVPTGWASGH